MDRRTNREELASSMRLSVRLAGKVKRMKVEFQSVYDLLKCRRGEITPAAFGLKERGMKGLLYYRLTQIEQSVEELTDSSNGKFFRLGEYFRQLYGSFDGTESQGETIFDCWSFLNRFLRGVTGHRWIREDEALLKLDEYFQGYETLKEDLDALADYEYSLANLMPTPPDFHAHRVSDGLGGVIEYDGKGNYRMDNQMPDLFYERARKNLPNAFAWLDENMERFSLQCFKVFKSYLQCGEANAPLHINDSEQMRLFHQSVKNAIEAIRTRAMRILKKIQKRNNYN
ncbi:MAG: hypothetical protein LBM60_06920 [Clostridium sp.]|jgi:hypothetical protein|nr:hypothetical protein [Clostridium sp.]